MKLPVPFIQLPLQFDAARLAAEVQALGAGAWRPHPQKYAGNFGLPLIAAHGDPESNATAGPMLPTSYLNACPYLSQVLRRLGAVWGRTRLMKLTAGAEVDRHVDINYYWRERMRVHVPIQTSPAVRFICGDAEVNMAAGECWLFDTWRDHRVINGSDHERIHLVADTVGGDRFWELVGRGRAYGQTLPGWRAEAGDGGQGEASPLRLERENAPQVMTPWELREHVRFLFAHLLPAPQLDTVQQAGQRFVTRWHALWSQYGDAPDGRAAFATLLDEFDGWLAQNGAALMLQNGMELLRTWRSMIYVTALVRDVHRREGSA